MYVRRMTTAPFLPAAALRQYARRALTARSASRIRATIRARERVATKRSSLRAPTAHGCRRQEAMRLARQEIRSSPAVRIRALTTIIQTRPLMTAHAPMMGNKRIKHLAAWALFLSLLFGASRSLAWTGPSSAAPADDSKGPLTSSSIGQSKIGGLILNTSISAYSLLVPQGKVGIGTAAPTSLFEVWPLTGHASPPPCAARCNSLSVPSGSAYNAGYSFTPSVSGAITKLWMRVQAQGSSFTVRLYNQSTHDVLASAVMTSAGPSAWVSSDIAPVSVLAGTNYIVAVGGPQVGYSYPAFSDASALYPLTVGPLRINYSVLKLYDPNGFPDNVQTGYMWGHADVTFVPAVTGSAFSVVADGKVGVGAQSSTSRLMVSGGLQLGADQSACTSAKAGTLRYASSMIDVCNGSAWVRI